MNSKLLGAMCIIVACGSAGFLMAHHHLVRMQLLRNLLTILDYMECELQFRCTPLPQLCRQVGEHGYGKLSEIFEKFTDELDAQVSPDAGNCMVAALESLNGIDSALYPVMVELGNNLGNFDLSGQLRGLSSVRNLCQEKLVYLSKDKESRLRSYQTLGLCTGAALAILFV